jgi:hypothetical protein
MTLSQCWNLAKQWYAGRTEPSWRGLGPAKAQKIFDSVGLTGDFWRMT